MPWWQFLPLWARRRNETPAGRAYASASRPPVRNKYVGQAASSKFSAVDGLSKRPETRSETLRERGSGASHSTLVTGEARL